MSDDIELERAIELVGREKVYARARQLGWGKDGFIPPKWVWYAIIAEITQKEQDNE